MQKYVSFVMLLGVLAAVPSEALEIVYGESSRKEIVVVRTRILQVLEEPTPVRLNLDDPKNNKYQAEVVVSSFLAAAMEGNVVEMAKQSDNEKANYLRNMTEGEIGKGKRFFTKMYGKMDVSVIFRITGNKFLALIVDSRERNKGELVFRNRFFLRKTSGVWKLTGSVEKEIRSVIAFDFPFPRQKMVKKVPLKGTSIPKPILQDFQWTKDEGQR